MFDICHTHETPEGVELEADIAGPFIRCLAFAIDFAIRAGILMVLAIVVLFTSYKNNFGSGVFLMMLFLIEWLYPLLFEYFRKGQTPGKKAMGIYVLNEDLTPLSFSGSLIRNLLRAADFLPLCYGFGFVTMVLSGRFQRLGDLAAGTIVVHKHNDGSYVLPAATQGLAPPIDLKESETQALTEFYLRQGQLSPARQKELSDIVENALKLHPEKSAEQLKLMGAWLLGARDKQ